MAWGQRAASTQSSRPTNSWGQASSSDRGMSVEDAVRIADPRTTEWRLKPLTKKVVCEEKPPIRLHSFNCLPHLPTLGCNIVMPIHDSMRLVCSLKRAKIPKLSIQTPDQTCWRVRHAPYTPCAPHPDQHRRQSLRPGAVGVVMRWPG